MNTGENATSADNQQGSRPIIWVDPSETTRRTPYSLGATRAYLQGAFHDGTWNRANKRTRFAQSNLGWLYILKVLLEDLGYTSWIYREGKTRSVYILETQASFLTLDFDPLRLGNREEKIAYVRGFFDAEGGIPRNPDARFYVQLVQNSHVKLEIIQRLLQELHIEVGKLHHPSISVDPDYWRMFVRTKSHVDFVSTIGSWHPGKVRTLRARVKI